MNSTPLVWTFIVQELPIKSFVYLECCYRSLPRVRPTLKMSSGNGLVLRLASVCEV